MRQIHLFSSGKYVEALAFFSSTYFHFVIKKFFYYFLNTLSPSMHVTKQENLLSQIFNTKYGDRET